MRPFHQEKQLRGLIIALSEKVPSQKKSQMGRMSTFGCRCRRIIGDRFNLGLFLQLSCQLH